MMLLCTLQLAWWAPKRRLQKGVARNDTCRVLILSVCVSVHILIYNYDIQKLYAHTVCTHINGLSINIINNVVKRAALRGQS